MEYKDEHPFQVVPHEVSCLNGKSKATDCLDVNESCFDNNDEQIKSDIPTLLKLIEEVHSQKLTSIDLDRNLNDKEKSEEKILALQSYIQQLQEQNDTFASTMIELEKEAQQRVTQMEKRLKSSAKTTMEAVINMHDCEKEMRRIVEERLYIESLYKSAQQHLSSIKVENGFLRDQNFNLNHDVQALLHIIHHARSTGHWEMDCVTFCEVTPEQVFGPVQSLSQIYPSESDSQDFCKEPKKKKKHYSSEPPNTSSLARCVSVPEIGNIYSCIQNIRRSNSCEINSNNTSLSVPAPSKYSNTKNRNTPELLKDLIIENLEQRLCIRKGQSEPHLFMFNDNIYKYRPCESNEKHSCDTLNENYESNHPPYQSIDLKFPTGDSTLKLCPWNKLKHKSYLESQRNSFVKETPNSSCNSSDTDIRASVKLLHLYNIFKERSKSSSHENQSRHSVGLQTEINMINQDTQVNSSVIDYQQSDAEENNLVQVLKDNLIKAKTKAEEKSILIEQLQNHLTSAVKEIELKDKVLSNLENKLQNSRDECSNLKNQVVDLNNEVQLIMKDVEDNHNLNANLKLQMEQQSHIIRTLQEALVQSKRAFDAVHPKMPSMSPTNSENKFSRSQQTSRSSIIDI